MRICPTPGAGGAGDGGPEHHRRDGGAEDTVHIAGREAAARAEAMVK